MKLIKAAASIFIFSSLLSIEVLSLAWASFQMPKEYPVAQVNLETVDNSSAITVDEIQAINREVEAVTAQGDVEGLLQYMAPFIISETITESSHGFESVYIEGIEQHREVLTSFFNKAETEETLNIQELSKKETIRVTPDGQMATAVISTVSEVFTSDELRLVTTTDTIRFARLQDQIKVIFYTTDSQITSHDHQN
ncbi:MAG: hypothetical protein AAF703_23720 [Cyanobacteria bacterium P01_D01_bin.105]